MTGPAEMQHYATSQAQGLMTGDALRRRKDSDAWSRLQEVRRLAGEHDVEGTLRRRSSQPGREAIHGPGRDGVQLHETLLYETTDLQRQQCSVDLTSAAGVERYMEVQG